MKQGSGLDQGGSCGDKTEFACISQTGGSEVAGNRERMLAELQGRMETFLCKDGLGDTEEKGSGKGEGGRGKRRQSMPWDWSSEARAGPDMLP